MDIVSSATKALQLIRLFYQDASGVFFFLSSHWSGGAGV